MARTLLILILILTVLLYGKLGNITPDLFLIFIIVTAARRPRKEIVPFAFFGGLLYDLLYSSSFIYTLSKTIIGAIIYFLRDKLFLDTAKLSIVLLILFVPIDYFLQMIIANMFYNIPFSFSFIELLRLSLLSLLIMPIYYYLLFMISKRNA
jgi:rod shape-determining protein MreD